MIPTAVSNRPIANAAKVAAKASSIPVTCRAMTKMPNWAAKNPAMPRVSQCQAA